MNKVILIGNITRDLEIRKTQNGKSVLNFSIAINEGYGDKKTTEYVEIETWEKTADLVGSYCSKGSKLMIEGKLKTRESEYQGQKRKTTVVVASNIEFLSPKSSQVQQTLTADDRDMTGHMEPHKNITIDESELPFY